MPLSFLYDIQLQLRILLAHSLHVPLSFLYNIELQLRILLAHSLHVPLSFLYDIELQLRILHDPADFEKLVVKAATSAEEVKVAVSAGVGEEQAQE